MCSARLVFAAMASVVIAGCSRPATQLVGVVATDIPSSEYGCVGVIVSRIDDGAVVPGDRRSFEVPALVQLPFSFGVTPPDGDPMRRVLLTAEAWPTCDDPAPGATPTVSRSLRTGFLSEQSLRVDLFLADRCRGVECSAGQTCDVDSGACMDIPEIAPEDLTPTSPGDEVPQPDGGVGRADAGPRDGGPSGPSVASLTSDWVLEGFEVPAATDPLTRVTGVCATPTGVAAAGFTNKEASFGRTASDATPISSGPGAIWVASVSSDGTIGWLRVFEGAAAIATIDLIDDLLVITGPFQGTFSFGPVDLTAVDMQDTFAAGLELSSGGTRWATSLGTMGGADRGVGAAGTDVGVLVGSRSATGGPFQIDGVTPTSLEGDARGEGLLALLDPATGAAVRAIGLGTGDLEVLSLRSDGARGALLGLASTGRMTGLHPLVAGGGGHEVTVARLDASARWAWTTYFEGCSATSSIRVTRNVGWVWAAFTAADCGSLPVTIATPGGSRAGAPIDPGATGQVLVTLGLDGTDGVPRAGGLRAVAIHPSGGTVGVLTADGSDALYVGGWLGLPAAGAMLDFGGGPMMFDRYPGLIGQSNGAAFLWSRGPDGAFRGVDSWSNGGAGAPTGESDLVTGIVIDATGLIIGGWLHGTGDLTDVRIGGGTGYDVAFLLHAR